MPKYSVIRKTGKTEKLFYETITPESEHMVQQVGVNEILALFWQMRNNFINTF